MPDQYVNPFCFWKTNLICHQMSHTKYQINFDSVLCFNGIMLAVLSSQRLSHLSSCFYCRIPSIFGISIGREKTNIASQSRIFTICLILFDTYVAFSPFVHLSTNVVHLLSVVEPQWAYVIISANQVEWVHSFCE